MLGCGRSHGPLAHGPWLWKIPGQPWGLLLILVNCSVDRSLLLFAHLVSWLPEILVLKFPMYQWKKVKAAPANEKGGLDSDAQLIAGPEGFVFSFFPRRALGAQTLGPGPRSL